MNPLSPAWRGALVVAALVAAAFVVPALAAATTTIKGEVVDLECSIGKGGDGKGEAHAACATSCAREGRTMAILTADEIVLIEGDYTANTNAKLLDFVAQPVEAKGHVSERDGKKFINVVAMAVQKAGK
jgi:type 1 fimbria pilin